MTDNIQETSDWIRLSEYPGNSSPRNSLIAINDHQFILVSNNSVFRYDCNRNEWIEWIKYLNKSVGKMLYFSSTLDTKNNDLYIYDNDRLIKINILTKEIVSYETDNRFDGSFSSISICNDRLNIFGGFIHGLHIIWDKYRNEYNEIYEFDDTLPSARLINIESEQLILLFNSDVIHLFYYGSIKKWEEYKINKNMSKYSNGLYVKTMDEKNIILFSIEHIYIIDINNWKTYKTKCVSPIFNLMDSHGVTIDSFHTKNLIINGYIRLCWNLNQFQNMQILPNDLINIIIIYYFHEFVYLVNRNGDNGHCKLSIDKLFHSMEYQTMFIEQ